MSEQPLVCPMIHQAALIQLQNIQKVLYKEVRIPVRENRQESVSANKGLSIRMGFPLTKSFNNTGYPSGQVIHQERFFMNKGASGRVIQ